MSWTLRDGVYVLVGCRGLRENQRPGGGEEEKRSHEYSLEILGPCGLPAIFPRASWSWYLACEFALSCVLVGCVCVWVFSDLGAAEGNKSCIQDRSFLIFHMGSPRKTDPTKSLENSRKSFFSGDFVGSHLHILEGQSKVAKCHRS